METTEINEKIKAFLNDCDKHSLVFVCAKIQTENGMNDCIKRIKNLLLKNKDVHLTLKGAIGHLEMELIEEKLY